MFVQDLEILLHWIDTLVLKQREILTTAVLHHPFRFEGTPTQGSKATGESFAYLPRKSLRRSRCSRIPGAVPGKAVLSQ